MQKRGRTLWKKLLSLALTAAMVLTILPMQPAFAAGEAGGEDEELDLPEKLMYFSFDEDMVSASDGNSEKFYFEGEGANAEVYDSTNRISRTTTEKKFGTGALYINNTGAEAGKFDNNSVETTKGTGGYLKVPAGKLKNADGTGKKALTVSYWSKVVDTGTGWSFFLSKDDLRGNSLAYIGMLESISQDYGLDSRNGSWDLRAAKVSKGSTSDWKHVLAVMTETYFELYVNGQKVAENKEIATKGGFPDFSNSSVFIGKAFFDTNEYFKGYIDDFTIYDGALTEAQAKAVSERDIVKAEIANGYIATKRDINLGIGGTSVIKPVNTLPQTVSDKITYTSADTKVAVVNEEGVVTGVGAGSTAITAHLRYAGITTDSAPIKVHVKSPADQLKPLGKYTFEGELGQGVKTISKGLTEYKGTVEYGTGRNGSKAIRTKDKIMAGETENPGYGVQLPENKLGRNYTVSMWINPANEKGLHPNGPVLAVGRGTGSDHSQQNWLAIAGHNRGENNAGRIWAHNQILNTSNKDFPGTDFEVRQNQWTMLTISHNEENVSFYQDGVLVGTGKADAVMDDDEGIICLGVNFWDAEFDGLIDDVYVYNTALSAEQVAAVYLQDADADSLKMLGDNKNVNMISENLSLPEDCNGIALTWESSDTAKIAEDGTVKVKDGSEVTLTAKASVEDLGFTWSKSFKLRLAKPINIKHVDGTNKLLKEETVYGQVGTDYTYKADKILTTETAAYAYDETANTAETLKVAVTEAGTPEITVKYNLIPISEIDKSKLPETVYVIEGNQPRLPKTVKGFVSSDDGQEKPAEQNKDAEGRTAGKAADTVDLPINWADYTELEPGEHVLNGKAAGHALSVKLHIFECDEAVADTAAENADDSAKVKLKNGYKGIIETEFDIEASGTDFADAGVQYYDRDEADNVNTFWLAGTSMRFDKEYFYVFSGNGKGGSEADSLVKKIPDSKENAPMLYDGKQSYHVRTQIDTSDVSAEKAENGAVTVAKNGSYRVWITDENGNTVELTSETNTAGFRRIVTGVIDKFGAARKSFNVTNHKISWQSGYVSKVIEIYLNETAEKKESYKLLPGSLLGEGAAEAYAYTPEVNYEKGDEIYILDEEKSGWFKKAENGQEQKISADDVIASAVQGATVTYKAYYKEGTNFPGLAKAVEKAQQALAEMREAKIYTDASMTALETAIKTAEGILETEGKDNEASKADVASAITTLNQAVVSTPKLKSLTEMNQILTAYYPFEKDAKDAKDGEGAKFDGQVTGDIQFTRDGGAELKGGSGLTNYISLPTDMKLSDKMTFSFWTYAEDGGGNNVFGIGAGTEIGKAHHFSVYVNNKTGMLSANAGKTGFSGPLGTGNIEFGLKQWHLVTCVVEEKNVTVYVDGEEKESKPIGASLTEIWSAYPENRSIYVGNNIYVLNEGGKYDPDYKGKVKSLRIYDACLADEQIKEIYDYEAALPMKHAIEDLVAKMGAEAATGDDEGKYKITITEEFIELLSRGPQNERITWKAFDAESGEESSAIIDIDNIDLDTNMAPVTLPTVPGAAGATHAVLKATIKLGDKTQVVEFICTIRKLLPEVEAARAELKTLLDRAAELNQQEYTTASWTEFQKVVAAAQAEYNNPGDAASLNQQKTALENAMKTDGTGKLVKRGDKTELEALIADAKAAMEDKNKSDYEESIWEALETAIKEAEELSDDVDQNAVDAKKAELQTALDNFQPKLIDKDALQTLVSDAEKILEGKEPYEYDKEVWAALEEAISEAKALAENPDATDEQIQAAYAKIQAAVEAFQPKVIDQEALNSLNTQAGEAMAGKNKADYEEAVWTALENAIKAVADLPEDATEEQIKETYKNLWLALENFKPKATDPVVPVTGVILDQTAITILENQTAVLTATVLPENATNKKVDWISDNTAVAMVDANGMVTGVKAGTANIIASAEGKTAVCAVTVNAPAAVKVPVSSVKLNKTKLTLGVKETFKLITTVKPANATNKKAAWKSNKPKVVTVKNGKLTAKKKGTATITVTVDGKKKTCKVTVKAAPKKIQKLNKTKVTIKKNKTFKIKVTLPKNTASNKITYTVKNKKIATVSAAGVIKGKKKGKTTVTVKTFNGKKKTITVTVK